MPTPSISVVNCGSAFSSASQRRQSYSAAQYRASSCNIASCTPCDASATSSRDGQHVAATRRRRPAIASPGISARNGRISVSLDIGSSPIPWVGRLARGVDGGGYPVAQNAQWCLAAKSVSSCGWGGTSDNICALPVLNAGQGTAAEAGLPVAAKVAQAVRMLAARACWSAVSGAGKGTFGRSNRYCSSEACVATGGGMIGPEKTGGALLSLNS